MTVLRYRFDEELETLRQSLLAMGAATEELVRDAVDALVGADENLAESVIERDDEVDAMERDLETRSLRLLTLQQPVLASDLRLVNTVLKAITDVERVGDHAVNLARVAQRVARETPYKPLVDIEHLGRMVCGHLHEALRAFVYHDSAQAKSVIEQDEAIDRLYREMKKDLEKAMHRNASDVLLASILLFAIHYLERIGDHCVNIAERVIYLETGAGPG